jgi:phenylalanyl-tRNA synthetase alpha chain
MRTMSAEELRQALACRDLTNPAEGRHALQQIVTMLEQSLTGTWRVPVLRDPGPRIVDVADNYDRLRYAPDAITRDSRYSHYIGEGRMLRSHTTARIPHLLAGVTAETLLSVPGMCHRRDSIDRHHTGQPHQIDLWRVRPGGPALTESDLERMVELVVSATVPGRRWWTVPNRHPYTLAGREIYVSDGDSAVEIGECGLAHPELLAAAGHAGGSGLAMGLGLDRLLMLAKNVPDIRLLRSDDERVSAQMLDLTPYRPVSAMPAVTRDLSLAIASDLDAELLGDKVRGLLGNEAEGVEQIVVVERTEYGQLPHSAIARMGMHAGQDNVLLRLVLRHPVRTLTAYEANVLRDRVYAGLHEGSAHEWATR